MRLLEATRAALPGALTASCQAGTTAIASISASQSGWLSLLAKAAVIRGGGVDGLPQEVKDNPAANSTKMGVP